jgi:mono/diheme cytochrome c family protein
MKTPVCMLVPCLAVILASCDLSMTDQPRYDTGAAAEAFPDGAASQPLPYGVVSQSDLALDADTANPPPATPAFVARGRERYDIYCSPCHGLAGNGDGVIVRRGFPAPPSYHSNRLRAAPGAHFFDVITRGYGVMYSYASRISPSDRWAIVAYIRALQLSRHAPADVAAGAADP